MFILDGSGSVSGNTFRTQMNMINRIIDMVEIGPEKTKIAVMQYSGYARVEFDFKEFLNKSSLKEGLKKIKHMSGTTRTGRALNKAVKTFRGDSGARLNHNNVAQVVILVGDGHSHDDPFPPAENVRKSGIIVLAVGIGSHINMDELEQMVGDSSLAFSNETMDHFIDKFREIAIGEVCDYAKKPRGAEVICLNNTIQVNILTKLPFEGQLYVPGYFNDSQCASYAVSNDDHRSISLTIPIDRCGLEPQFLFNPSGLLFETGVILKYHPEYSLEIDKLFAIRCFYPDMRRHYNETENKGKDQIEIQFSTDDDSRFDSNGLPVEHPQVASFSAPEMTMPCSYTLNKEQDKTCVLENANVGETIIHKWQCDENIFGNDYAMLIHSCYAENPSGTRKLIIDEKGCSLDSYVIDTPHYIEDLLALVAGRAVKFADNPMVKYKCFISLCHKPSGECEGVVPPQCDDNVQFFHRSKRQVQIIRTDHRHMPQHMIERLFQRRQQHRRGQISNHIGDVSLIPTENGQAEFITLRPIGSAAKQSPKNDKRPVVARRRRPFPRRPSPVVVPLVSATNVLASVKPIPPVNPAASRPAPVAKPASSRPAAVVLVPRPVRPRPGFRRTISLTEPVIVNAPKEVIQNINSDITKFVELNETEKSETHGPNFNISQEIDSVEIEGSGEEEETATSSFTQTTSTTIDNKTEPSYTTTTSQIPIIEDDELPLIILNTLESKDEEKVTKMTIDDVDLQGLAADIVSKIDITKVNLESQTIAVHDLENFREKGGSPVEWCPRAI